MRLGFAQYNIFHKDKVKNLEKISYIIKNTNANLLVLPELCNTGYVFNSKDSLKCLAENIPNGDTTKLLISLTSNRDIIIVAGIAEIEDDILYNSALVVHSGKYIGKYRKIHLSDYEKNIFDRGNSNKIFDLGNIKIGVQICFDLWFPEISREQMLKGANILCVPSNFGGTTTLNIAKVRAIENITPMILCNRIGREKDKYFDASFLGNSLIIDSDGTVISEEIKSREFIFCSDIEIYKKRGNVICDNFEEEIRLHYT